LLVSDGAVATRTTAIERPKVQMYLDGIEFAEITDLDPPRVEISADGTMAWLMGHVRVHGAQRQTDGTKTQLSFDAAWIDIWEKKSNGWRIVARANTEKENSTP